MGRVEAKVIVITGAASGQGAAEAVALAREGATVIATDVHDEAPSLPADGGGAGAIIYRRLDVSRVEDWQQLRAWLEAEHERVDGLVNNAGIPWRERLEDVDLADWDRVIGINLTGPLLGIRTVAPLMSGGGSIVNVSSVAGLGGFHAVAYTVSKWGLRGLSKVAALELGPRGIRVNTLLPGYIETPMTASAPAPFRGANLKEIPLGRTGTVDDIAPLVVYLMSDESSFVSSMEFVVDGGMTGHGGTKVFSDVVRAAAEAP
jgi:3alpha(or 20beta)-hydroxysteroid dehydrogenase